MKSKRFVALCIDVFLIALFSEIFHIVFNLMGLKPIGSFSFTLGFILLLCKDCFNGMSIGRRVTNIQVFDTVKMKVASPAKCVLRNMFVYIFYFVEVLLVLFSSSGLRIGDYIAHTKVLERDTQLKEVDIYKTTWTISIVTIIFVILYILAYIYAYKLGFFRLWFLL